MFFFGELKSQNLTIEKIDLLMETSQTDNLNGDFKAFLAKQNIILKESKKENYSKGIAKAYLYIGVCYQQFGDCGKALTFYNDALKEKYAQTDLSFQSDIYCSIGNCYRQQYLYKDALKKYWTAVKIGEKSDGDINFIKTMNYNNIATVHQVLETPNDSAYHYYSKAVYYSKHLSGLKGNRINITPIIYINIGEYWERNKRIDSTDYYFSKAIMFNKEVKNIIIGATLEYRLGVIHLHAHNYEKADYYLEKAKVTFEKKKNLVTLADVYTALTELNKITGNKKKYAQYQDLLASINAQINQVENSGVMATVDSIMKEKDEVFKRKETRLYWIIVAALVITLLFFVFALYFHKSITRKKENIITDSEKQIAEKKIIIEQKDIETKELKLKVNESFEEVVQLSKENSPEFLTRFQEVYPDYYQKLINIHPRLLTTEVKLCAMLYLGFSAKDIAEYTFVTIKAAQHRKFRLRKKLNIPSDADINNWIKDFT